MTAPTRSTLAILAAVALTGGTKAAPPAGGTGAWIDVRTLNGGQIGISLVNGATAPGTQGQFTLQGTDANQTEIYEFYNAGGSLANAGEVSFTVELPPEFAYVRMLAYGNTTNAVTYKAHLFAKA